MFSLSNRLVSVIGCPLAALEVVASGLLQSHRHQAHIDLH